MHPLLCATYRHYSILSFVPMSLGLSGHWLNFSILFGGSSVIGRGTQLGLVRKLLESTRCHYWSVSIEMSTDFEKRLFSAAWDG